MNAKEEVLRILNAALDFQEWTYPNSDHSDFKSVITAVENAIFDVPSEDEILKEANKITVAFSRERFLAGCNFILNYKKPESDEK